MHPNRIPGLRGLALSLTGWAVEAYAILYYACWVLPRCAWRHWAGRLPLDTIQGQARTPLTTTMGNTIGSTGDLPTVPGEGDAQRRED